MTITTKATAKVAAVATGLAMATSMLSLAPLAHAQTPTAAPSCTITMSLTVGSTGAEVICLQAALVAKGYLVMPVGTQMGYFGALTKSAVAKWQSANGISPAAGYFGPISRAAFTGVATGGAMVPGCTSTTGYSTTTGQSCATATSLPAGCTSAMGFSPTTGVACNTTGTTPGVTGPLAGTDGTISDVTELGSYNTEKVGESQKAVKVLGADVEASTDGDIALKSVKVSFDSTGNTGSDNLDDYIKSVSVWMGSEKVGSADVSEFTESGVVFSKTITLSGNTTIKADSVAKLYVAVDAANTFDSADISGDSWTVDVDSIRFVDGSGVFTTDSSTGEIDGMDVPVDFVSFSSASDTEFKISTASDTPSESIVVIDDTSNTDNVLLLKGKIKLDGTSKAVLDEFPVTLTTVGGANLAAVTGSVTLKIGSEEFTESVSSSATTASITFDNLGFDISAGETVSFSVSADINDIDAGNLDEGDTLTASVTATNRDYIDVENAEGDQLSDSTEKSGTATGQAQQFRTNGIGLSLVSVATSVAAGTSANDDQGTFKITYKVTAIGDTMYVSSLVDAVASLTTVTTGKTSVHFERAGTATNGGTSVALANLTDKTLNAAGLYQIEEGSSETFEVTGTGQLPTIGAAGLFRMVLNGVAWSTSSTDATPNNQYTSSNANLDGFETSYVGLN